ncbi:MAG TPA: cyclopentanol dehydrogenase [Porticoccaceae bacterium]|jgi:cyclopentanol dehydrogenase|nr:cyclopentanol dehydrogenase [Porticoccaceae bacterium]
MAGRVQDKVCLVTGGGLGMGREHALLLAEEGGRIVLTDIDEAAGQKTVEDVNAAGGEAVFIKQDVAAEAEWKTVVATAVEHFGKVDVLVNNAGVLRLKTIQETTAEDWDFINDINTKGLFFGVKHILPAMEKAGGGSIINISSIYGIAGAPSAAAYQASKGAVRVFTKSAAVEYAAFNIRVNSVHPGVIATAMTADVIADDEATQALLGSAIIRRPAQPKEVSWGVLFLASDESSYMTGSELVIDGGYTAT